jgi:ABC-2 type transport system ATP-binding protein
MGHAVEMRDVVKTFGATRALDGLDLHVAEGEIHGYLGPNGAGKSVTIRTLLGLLRHDSGAVELLGGDPWRGAVALHRRLAYVPGDVSLWPNLSGGEIIDYFARLRGDLAPARRDALVERFDLDPRKKASTYSKGNRQKVALITALSSDAELLIFDEPTSGLDPLMETVFQACVGELAAEGRTVLLSSHILAEVEKLCDRVTIIRKGRAVQSGSLDDLRTTTRTSVTVSTDRHVEGLTERSGVHAVRRDETHLHLEVETAALGDTMSFLSTFGIRSLVSQPPTLEELFLRQYGDTFDVDDGATDDSGGDGRAGSDDAGVRPGEPRR